MVFSTPVPLAFMLLLTAVTGRGQTELGVQAGGSVPYFFYKETQVHSFFYEDDSVSYQAGFADESGWQANSFIRLNKGNWSFTAMAQYQFRKTVSTESYSNNYTQSYQDPWYIYPGVVSDERTVNTELQGIYGAVLPGFGIKIGEGKLYLNAGFYAGYIFKSSSNSSGITLSSDDGTETTQAWSNRVTENGQNTPDAGFIGSFGFNYPLAKAILLQAEFQGSRGILNLGAGDFGYYASGHKINSSNAGFNVGVFYRFE